MEIKSNPVPDIVFESGWLLDSSVADLSNHELKQEALDEVSSRLAEFQASWDDVGRPLLFSAVKESGMSFLEKDIKGSLICGQLFSQSHPLLINIKYYLNSLQKKPRPLTEFAEQVFHELLHILLQDNLRKWPTPTAEKYSDQGFEVIAHLHLMALQRRSHEDIGNSTAWLADWYGDIGGDYSKTWKTVSEDVVYFQLLKELSTEFGRS
jgi:hypothetical protein